MWRKHFAFEYNRYSTVTLYTDPTFSSDCTNRQSSVKAACEGFADIFS